MRTPQELTADFKAGLDAMQELQKYYDADMWEIQSPDFAKIRHIHIHLSHTVGKLARAIEPVDHQNHKGALCDVAEVDGLPEIVADLLMHCAQLGNLAGSPLWEMYLARYRQNARRFAPESSLADLL